MHTSISRKYKSLLIETRVKIIKLVCLKSDNSLFSLSKQPPSVFQSLLYLYHIQDYKITDNAPNSAYNQSYPDVIFFYKEFSVRCFRRVRLYLITEPDQIWGDVACQRQECDTMYYCFTCLLSRDIRIGLETSHNVCHVLNTIVSKDVSLRSQYVMHNSD